MVDAEFFRQQFGRAAGTAGQHGDAFEAEVVQAFNGLKAVPPRRVGGDDTSDIVLIGRWSRTMIAMAKLCLGGELLVHILFILQDSEM